MCGRAELGGRAAARSSVGRTQPLGNTLNLSSRPLETDTVESKTNSIGGYASESAGTYRVDAGGWWALSACGRDGRESRSGACARAATLTTLERPASPLPSLPIAPSHTAHHHLLSPPRYMTGLAECSQNPLPLPEN
ncbi:unnamed protein product, partial [Brenthis ino]